MSLESFQFTQSSLQDYVDCPRRFQLRYVLDQPWPAVESEPLMERERLAELGRRFHKLIQQHVEGLSAETLTASIGEPESESFIVIATVADLDHVTSTETVWMTSWLGQSPSHCVPPVE